MVVQYDVPMTKLFELVRFKPKLYNENAATALRYVGNIPLHDSLFFRRSREIKSVSCNFLALLKALLRTNPNVVSKCHRSRKGIKARKC